MLKLKKLCAVSLALIMALSSSIMAFADQADTFLLETNSTSIYEGMSYEITATVTNATAADLENNTFVWDTDGQENGATINSKNNFSDRKNADGTYTVTETATVVTPVSVPEVTVKAAFADRVQELTLTLLKPIDSFEVNFENNDHAYYDSEINTLYLDRMKNDSSTDEYVNFEIKEITPEASDDEISVFIDGIRNSLYDLKKSETVDNLYTLSIKSSATGQGVIKVITKSGKTLRSTNLQICVPATKCTLSRTPYGSTTATPYVTVSDVDGRYASIPAVAGKQFTITAGDSLGNDDIKFVLYTDGDCQNKALDKYYTVNDKKCEISIDVPGTYYLLSTNYSKDNGKLKRTLGSIITEIYVSDSFPIQKIELFKLDEDNKKTTEPLEEIVLYTNTAATYNLENSVSVDPDYNTDTKTYMSYDEKIAKVNATTGVITAVGKGETTVWVRSSDNSSAIASVNVIVKIGVKAITSIKKADNSTFIPSGHVQKLIATTNPADADEPVYWSSSNPDVLSIDAKTGVITAKDVEKKTPVTIYAVTASGVSSYTLLNVVPAKRAESVNLNVECDSSSFKVDESSTYKVCSDYFQTTAKNRKPITVSASAQGVDGSESNDEYIWSISYNDSAAIPFEEAAEEGYISYTELSLNTYSIIPQNTGEYCIYCKATANATEFNENDPFDMVTINMLQCATIMSVKDTEKGNDVSGTIYLPIRESRSITVKTSTPENDRYVDPPTCKIVSGGEYVNVTESVSEDGEGITYIIEGLKYGKESTKITFASTSGSKSSTLTINVRNNLDDVEVVGVPASVEYTANNITFDDFGLRYNGSSLDQSLYSVKYTDNKNAGTAKITITGKNEYNGSVRVVEFNITPKAFSSNNVQIDSINPVTISTTVTEATPSPTVFCDGVKLTKDKDYTVSYRNNTKAGKATVIVNGIGNYSGTASASFDVIDTAEKFKVSKIANQIYSGKQKTPNPVVKYYGKTLKKDVDYTLTYENNINTGVATVKISGIGKFNNSITTTFKIYPRDGRITSLKGEKKGFTVKWSKQQDISGYQIQYSLNKKLKKGNKTRTVTDININSLTVKKLKKSKNYYVRMRSFKIVDGVKYYGKWSKIVRVKTKK